MTLVSVALCSNSVDEYFFRAVDSILTQEFDDFEIIVVLNGNAQHQVDDVLSRYTHIKHLRVFSTSITFINHSLNLAIDHSSGKYIARMDADDIAYSDRLATQYKFLEANHDVVVCGAWYDLVDENDTFVKQLKKPCTDGEIRSFLTYRNPFCHPTVMFRRDVVAKLGGYLSGMYAEDYDLWVRVARRSEFKFANIPQSLLGYRQTTSGQARGSRIAHQSVSEIAWREFISSGKPKWLLAAILSTAKALILGR